MVSSPFLIRQVQSDPATDQNPDVRAEESAPGTGRVAMTVPLCSAPKSSEISRNLLNSLQKFASIKDVPWAGITKTKGIDMKRCSGFVGKEQFVL